MAKKSSSAAAAELMVDMMFAPVTIAVGVGKAISRAHKASVKDRERRERLAAQEAKRQERLAAQEAKQRERAARMAEAEARRAQAEAAREERERAKAAKKEAMWAARAEAELNRKKLAYASLEDRYRGAFSRHAELGKLIEKADDDLMRVEYCKEDIDLLPMLLDYETRKSIIECRSPVYPQFDVFLTLSMAYERLGMYPHAILACQQAMDMGFAKAGEGSSFEQRIESLRNASHMKGDTINGEV